ncbi:hypothetical protein CKA32_005153 [Geitlerinema sp. FC II]|nr:hypothetical protein CKA32_005153 [Geitlerinema sp. FC II]
MCHTTPSSFFYKLSFFIFGNSQKYFLGFHILLVRVLFD